MKSSEPVTCLRCGAPIPAGAADRCCPACLLSGALDADEPGDKTLEVTPSVPRAQPESAGFPHEFGGYRLVGLLGRGGMGAVYEAEQLVTGRRVALKMLEQQLDSAEMRQRFLREGRLAARVNHPNSLYIFGSEEIEGLPVITMEIAGGGTLKDQIKRRGPLPVKEAVDAMLDVIAGLESASTVGVLHRDIKPSNCFVAPDGSVKVGDFGLSVSTLAKTDTFVTAHGKILGTPAYAAPEQLQGDALDVRADIYSVGATLFTLLTDRAPFEGDNAVQVVANAVNKDPKPLSELREDVPPGLTRVVARCLAKQPDGRYADYAALRDALLPFGSKEPEPASLKMRAAAGWIDYLIAFLVPYLAFMFLVGGEKLLITPVVERTISSARYYLALFVFGFLYFSIVEGLWGAGLGKRLKGLRVVRAGRRAPGIGRALLRILIPILCIEGVRMPLSMLFISSPDLTGAQIAWFVILANACAWLPVLMTLSARAENGFATFWDLVSGTRVVIQAQVTMRPSVDLAVEPKAPAETAEWLGPYQVVEALVPGRWMVASDPVLRRHVWLLRREAGGPSVARQNLARPGRLRWLQKAEVDGVTWDAYEATRGVAFTDLAREGRVPWKQLRHWLHDLAAELWQGSTDPTLPTQLSLDQVWITEQGQAVLLDEPWPGAKKPVEGIPVTDLAGQQRFLSVVASYVETTSLPVHARPVLRNLAAGKFEKLSFLTGILRGLLDKPVEVTRANRAGSIFMVPLYVWVVVCVGYAQGGGDHEAMLLGSVGWIALSSAVMVLGIIALIQLLGLPFRTTSSHAIFRLAVVDAQGERAQVGRLLARWALVWLPLLLPMIVVAQLLSRGETSAAFLAALVILGLWIGGAACSVVHPNRGWHDRLANTWVVRR